MNGISRKGGKLVEKTLDLILQKLTSLEEGQKSLEVGQKNLAKKVNNIESELKEFRTETRTSLQIIHTGQQGTREEMTQRFKEVKHSLSHLESDITLTFQKTVQNELELNRIKNQ
ncbi:hypothetical protein [Schinkia azotoformans]|uniref:hypothetical protein n=1 Tax=Schinkia azotoformans TaxID=1454 RepID=UPI003D29F389